MDKPLHPVDKKQVKQWVGGSESAKTVQPQEKVSFGTRAIGKELKQ